MLLEHWHDEKGSGATLIDERDEAQNPPCRLLLPEVRDMNTLLRCRKARERDVRYVGLDESAPPPPVVHVCWLTVPRDRAKGVSLTKEKISKLRFANARGAG